MKERKIAFNGAMVRAILAGQKTQTRRMAKPVKHPDLGNLYDPGALALAREPQHVIDRACPYGQPGDRLWVQEEWGDVNLYGAPAIAYSADGDLMDLMEYESFLTKDGAFNYEAKRIKPYSFDAWAYDLIGGIEGIWRPAKHMPRWASRILLEVVSVRVERLHDCSSKDAISEGIHHYEHRWRDCDYPVPDVAYEPVKGWPTRYSCPVQAYRALWESIYGEGSWAANPWVWVVEFGRVEE